MKRKLLFLNLALAGLLVAGGFELNRRVNEARARYEILQRFEKPKDAPAFPPPPAVERVRQAEYMPIVDHLLFYKDRNAIVEVEAPVEKVVSKPPLPILTGVLNLGDGPIAMMAVNSKSAPETLNVGDRVGEYTFLGFAGDSVKLSWNGEEMVFSQDKLVGEASGPAKGEARASGSDSARSAAAQRLQERHERLRAEAKTPTQKDDRKTLGGRYNIGTEIRPGVYRADPKDTAPEGTEFEGYRKVVRKNPFGTQSWWERKDAPK